jgi:hypothetical protein
VWQYLWNCGSPEARHTWHDAAYCLRDTGLPLGSIDQTPKDKYYQYSHPDGYTHWEGENERESVKEKGEKDMR